MKIKVAMHASPDKGLKSLFEGNESVKTPACAIIEVLS
jgi:hypothetical protein